MSTTASTLKSRNKAQADLKFGCLKVRKSVGGARKLEHVSVEEWEACRKTVQKIIDVLKSGDVDGCVVRSYGVEDLAAETKSCVAAFVNALESIVDGISLDDGAKFQVGEKMDLARAVFAGLERLESAVENVLDGERKERKQWEEKNPRLAEQERELRLYEKTLRELLLGNASLNRLEKGQWIQAEGCLRSLEPYLLEHKIEAQRVRDTRFEEVLRALLKKFEDLDREGIDRKNLDVERVERIWGLVDKLGSGLMWLVKSDKLWTPREPVSHPAISDASRWNILLTFLETYHQIHLSLEIGATRKDDFQHK